MNPDLKPASVLIDKKSGTPPMYKSWFKFSPVLPPLEIPVTGDLLSTVRFPTFPLRDRMTECHS